MTHIADASVPDVPQSTQYTWTLTAYQQQGNLWLQWSTTAPFRAQQDQVMVYQGNRFPSNPQDEVKTWCYSDQNGGGGGWNTGLPWGSGWYVARIAQASPNGPYQYFLQAVT